MQKNEGNSGLHPETNLGYVHLIVSNLERALVFYQRSLGFQVHHQGGDTAYLGAGQNDLLVLTEQPGAIRVPRTTGLTLPSWFHHDWNWREFCAIWLKPKRPLTAERIIG